MMADAYQEINMHMEPANEGCYLTECEEKEKVNFPVEEKEKLKNFPVEMMDDSVWIDRLNYEQAEAEYQMFVSKCAKESVDAEERQIDATQKEGNLTYKRLNIPQIYHPFIYGPDNENALEIENVSGARIKFPTLCVPKDEVIVAGEMEGVQKAADMIMEIFRDREKQCKSISVEVKKSHHSYIIGLQGAAVQEILRSTGVSVEIPRLDSDNETITLRGENDKLGKALNQVYEKVQVGLIKEKENTLIQGAPSEVQTVVENSSTSTLMEVQSSEKKKMIFPQEMMYDSVWINRLEYDEAEAACQVLLNKNNSVIHVEHGESSHVNDCVGYEEVAHSVENSGDLFESSCMNTSSEESFQSCVTIQSEGAFESEEEFSLQSPEYAIESIQVEDFTILRDAVINLTKAVSTLSVQNVKLTDENTKLRNRIANAEQRMDSISKNNNPGLKNKVDKLETRIQTIDGKMRTANNNSQTGQQTKQLDQMKQQLLTVFHHGNQKTTEAIKKLENTQQVDKLQFDDAMKSLRQYLHNKDTERKDEVKKLKSSIEDLVTKKTQSMEKVIKEIQKQQDIDKEAIETIKEIKKQQEIDKETIQSIKNSQIIKNSNDDSNNKEETVAPLKTLSTNKTSTSKKQTKLTSSSSNSSTTSSGLLEAPKSITDTPDNDIIDYLHKANEYLEYFQKESQSSAVTTTTMSSTKPKPTSSWTKATECPPIVPTPAPQRYSSYTTKSATTTKEEPKGANNSDRTFGMGVYSDEIDDGVWSEVEAILQNSPDRCLLLSQLPIQYRKQLNKDFPFKKNVLPKFLKESSRRIRIVGKGESSLILYIDPEHVPPYLLVNHLMCTLNECESFRASPGELSQILWTKDQITVKASRILQEIRTHSTFFEVSQKLVELSRDAKMMFLRIVMAVLVKRKKDGVVLSNFGNSLTKELGWNFSLAYYGYSSFQEVLNSCGKQFFLITGTGNEKMVKLGPLGELFCNLITLIKSKGGTLILQMLASAYREMFHKDLSFLSLGFNGIDEFATHFCTDFTIYGENVTKTIVLNDTIMYGVDISGREEKESPPMNVQNLPSAPGASRPAVELQSGKQTAKPAKLESSRTGNIAALRCEVVNVRGKSACVVARCTIVNYDLVVIYDQYIRPEKTIVDYRTSYSGIREHHMRNAVSLVDARKEITSVLKGKIIVGYNWHADFESLKMSFPRRNRRDLYECTLLFNKVSHGKPTLRQLMSTLLKREIQTGSHSSVEYASAAMELYKLVAVQWEREISKGVQ